MHGLEQGEVMTQQIVVVDDTNEILMLIAEIFGEEGYAVVTVGSPLGALETITEVRPDLIILDHLFGGQPAGWELFQALRRHDVTATIPVVVCTGAANVNRELDRYVAAPAVLLLHKPFDLDALLTAVHQLLSRERGNNGS